MKESGIEKLVELLNEFEVEKATRDYTWRIEKQNETRICGTEYTGAYVDDEETERIIISKKYKFIEWLVRGDKIDESKIEIHWFSFYESVLMELSIQDNPIEFLISILDIRKFVDRGKRIRTIFIR